MEPLLALLIVALLSALFRAWLVNFGKAVAHNIVFHVLFGVIGTYVFSLYEPGALASPVGIGFLFGYTVPAFFECIFSAFGGARWH